MKKIESVDQLSLNDEEIQHFDNVELSPEVQKELMENGYDVVIINNPHFKVHSEGIGVPASLEDDDEKDWNNLNRFEDNKTEIREKARWLAKEDAFVKRALKLYKMYVFGSDFDITLKPFYEEDEPEETQREKDKKIIKQANRAWHRFIEHNKKWWTPDELGMRTWRDGEQFSVKYKESEWPPELRFVDPEEIDDEGGKEQFDKDGKRSWGIRTDPKDVATVLSYVRIDSRSRELIEKLKPEQVWHTKIDVDSTQKRGLTRFYPVIKWIRRLEGLVDNEVTHRTLQSSIVLIRRVAGGTSAAQGILNNAKTSQTKYTEATINREKIRPGSIITVSNGTEIDFAEPSGTFSDASPLVKVLIIHLCAATGWSYSMITTDAADGSFASSLTNESPVLQMVLDERKCFRDELVPIFKWVMEKAIDKKMIKDVTVDEIWDKYDPEFVYGDIVSRDSLRDGQAANIGIMSGAISRAEGSRRMKADPDKMRREREEEMESDMMNMMGAVGGNSMNPNMQDKLASSSSNAQKGQGTNQGDGGPVSHKDKVS